MERRKMEFLMNYKTIDSLALSSDLLLKEDLRLDASSYLNEGNKILIKLQEKRITTQKLENFLQDVFYPNRFSRIFVESSNDGIKFLSSKDMLRYDYENVKLISKETKNLENYLLKDNWILISRSGTIGNISLVYDDNRGMSATEHIIRLIPKKEVLHGYLYAYLCSKIGHELIKKPTFGSIVDEIEPFHIKQIPLIILEKKKQAEIHKKIIHVFELRKKANKLINYSLELFYQELNLPKLIPIDSFLFKSKIHAWEINQTSDSLRLDGNYYNLDAQYAISTILNHKKKKWVRTIGVVTDVINPPRSSRLYVKSDHGIPYYSGTNLSEFSKNDLKFLSKKHEDINQVKIKKGWILVTRVGTIGIPYFVDESKDGHCASDNILRIIPNENVLPEFLYVFFKSKYGQLQLNQIKTGSVQDYIPEEYVSSIRILVPDYPIQKKIGKNINTAFKLRAESEKIEDECKKEFENLII